MNVEIKLDTDCIVPKIIICTNEITEEVTNLVQKLKDVQTASLIGYQEDTLVILNLDHIIRIYAEQNKVYAQTQTETVQLKLRLYEVEERLRFTKFVRISNSEIVNFGYVKNLSMAYNGTIMLTLQSSQKSYVSRRYVPKIKQYLGI